MSTIFGEKFQEVILLQQKRLVIISDLVMIRFGGITFIMVVLVEIKIVCDLHMIDATMLYMNHLCPNNKE